MRAFTYTIRIERSPEQTWDYMTDFSHASRWMNLVRRLDVIAKAPLGVGSEVLVTIDLMGKVDHVVSEVWAFEPGRRLGFRNTRQNTTGAVEYTLAPESG